MSIEQNKATIQRLFEEVYNAKQVAVLDELLTADYVDHNLAQGLQQGPTGLGQFVQFSGAVFPDNHLTIEDMLAEGDKVTVRWTSYNTHSGAEFYGIPPSGKRVVLTGTTIYRLIDGKVAELWHNEDLLGMLIQLGVPSPLG